MFEDAFLSQHRVVTKSDACCYFELEADSLCMLLFCHDKKFVNHSSKFCELLK